jgi:hypothetical protein
MEWEGQHPLQPITLVETRYGGTYEGGRWAAFAKPEFYVPYGSDPATRTMPPDGAFAEDPVAHLWWLENADRVGVGSLPGEALADLLKKSPEAPR